MTNKLEWDNKATPPKEGEVFNASPSVDVRELIKSGAFGLGLGDENQMVEGEIKYRITGTIGGQEVDLVVTSARKERC